MMANSAAPKKRRFLVMTPARFQFRGAGDGDKETCSGVAHQTST
jgi:hypothetical protein